MNTSERISYLVLSLGLLPHPEGGFYKETYRSKESTDTAFGTRNLATSIYFLLTSQHVSRFHRIKSDEHWYFHEGSPLTVHTLSENGYQKLHLGPVADGYAPYHMVPADIIFGSSVDSADGYALVSCAVSPGFDFQDFELFTEETLLKDYPDHGEIIQKLT